MYGCIYLHATSAIGVGACSRAGGYFAAGGTGEAIEREVLGRRLRDKAWR